MHKVRKKIVRDEGQQPVAVQIGYEDWLEIERSLKLQVQEAKTTNLSQYSGVITLTEDPLAYQTRVRGEWS